MPGRSKREERRRRLEEEEVAQRIRERAERQVTASVWDRDPIKQYVRRFGWLQVIQDFVKRRQDDGVDCPLKYLTIPGANASDIGFLWRAGLLVRTADGFPYVAICDKENADTVSRNLGVLLGVSDRWFHEALCDEFESLFPFDIVNLDFCGAMITGHPKRHRAVRRLAAIEQIFRLQRGQSFLLLLTASTDDESAHQILEELLVDNFDQSPFTEAYLSKYGVLDATPFQGNYRAFVRLVLPKLVGWIARDSCYKVVERFVATYDRPTHKLICHSFELEQLGRRQPAKKYEPRVSFWEELTEKLSDRTRRSVDKAYVEFVPTLVHRDPDDVPRILAENPDLEATLKSEAESLVGWWNRAEPD
jgi:hypothetical protein